MRYGFAAALAGLCLTAAAAPAPGTGSLPVTTYTNPVDLALADPAVLFHEGTYYLTGTTYDRFVSRERPNVVPGFSIRHAWVPGDTARHAG